MPKYKHMPNAKWRNHLRTVRRSWGLTQAELAYLCKCESANHVARIEAGDRSPNWHFVFASYVLFNESVDWLFGSSFAPVEEETMRRAKELFDKLETTPNATNKRKQALLSSAQQKVIERGQPRKARL